MHTNVQKTPILQIPLAVGDPGTYGLQNCAAMPEDVPLIDVLVTNGNLHACLTTRQPTARQALAVGGVDQADEG